jgi:vacuolar-type H+-ATPase subunit H
MDYDGGEMDPEPSLLELISEKEEALKRETDLVCVEADRILAEARRKADEIINTAKQEGEREANRLYEQHMEALSREIAEMHREGDRKSESMHKKGEQNLPLAVSRIIDAVTG